MRIDTQTIQSPTIQSLATGDLMPQPALGAKLARRAAIAATVLATTTAVLLVSGFAVVMSLT